MGNTSQCQMERTSWLRGTTRRLKIIHGDKLVYNDIRDVSSEPIHKDDFIRHLFCGSTILDGLSKDQQDQVINREWNRRAKVYV